MTALAPTANAGKEYVCGEVVAYTLVYNPESRRFGFSSPFKTNNKQSWRFIVAVRFNLLYTYGNAIMPLFLRQLPHLSGMNP